MNPVLDDELHVTESLSGMAVAFNFYLLNYVHPSWIENDQYVELIDQLKPNEKSHLSLSRYLLKRFNLVDDFDFDFSDIEKRVVFAAEEELEKLAFYLGIILNESVIRTVIVRSEREALRRCLGDDGYQFAVKKAQFFIQSSTQPEPSLLIDWNYLDKFKRFLMRTGFQVIGQAFSKHSVAIRKRLVLKLPKEWYKVMNGSNKLSLGVDQAAQLMVKTHKEANRQWRPLLS